MKKTLLLPTSIIVASVILGGFYYATQTNKQESIERQQEMKIEAEKEEQKREMKFEEYKEKKKNSAYTLCVEQVEEDYWNYMKINGTKKEDGTIWASDRFWDTAEANKQQAIANCLKQHKE